MEGSFATATFLQPERTTKVLAHRRDSRSANYGSLRKGSTSEASGERMPCARDIPCVNRSMAIWGRTPGWLLAAKQQLH